MTFFQKYFNWLFIALCVAGVYYGKLYVGAWLLLFSAGIIVFAYFAIVFLRERNFFEQKLSAATTERQTTPLFLKIDCEWLNIEKFYYLCRDNGAANHPAFFEKGWGFGGRGKLFFS